MTILPDSLQFVLPMMRGDAVRLIQTALALRGFLPPDGVDGLFGPQTRRAVAAFQRSCRLAPTGIVDGATRALLLAAGAAAPPAGADLAPLRRRQVEEVLSPEALPDARPARVVLHWTAGGGRASAIDREHYHFMIEQDGTIVRGKFSIADNDSTADNRYAAHVRSKNTRSVGVALCGMADAREEPFHPGTAPIVPLQIDRMAALVAQICARYDIPVTRETVLAHGEVQAILGAAQKGKWDPLVLPWQPGLSKREVGDHLRARVAQALTGLDAENDPEARPLDLKLGETRVPLGAYASDGLVWAPLQRLVGALGWSVAQLADGQVTLRAGERLATVPLDIAPGVAGELADGVADLTAALGVRLDVLAEQLDLSFSIDDEGVVLGDGASGGETALDGVAFRRVTVAAGDTLAAIARREMGGGGDWTAIRALDGSPISEEAARRLQPGEQVLVPAVAAPPAARNAADNVLAQIASGVASETHSANRVAVREAVPRLLRACLAAGVTDPAHLAYVLATAEHETNFGRTMEEVWRDTKAQRAYERSSLNERPGDGKLFCGRGYVQLTFRHNYRRFGKALNEPLEANPERAANPDVAARIMAAGMSQLGYRSRKNILGAYGEGTGFDFEGARSIVNGDRDRFAERYGTKIGLAVGRQARKYFEVIRDALPA